MNRVCLSCSRVIEASRRRCPECQRAFDRAHNAARPPVLRALYSSSAWQKLRAEVVSVGRCHWCGATSVRLVGDHVIPAIDRPDLALERDNVVPSCYSCNNKRRRPHGLVRRQP